MLKGIAGKMIRELKENVEVFWDDHPNLTVAFVVLCVVVLLFASSSIYYLFDNKYGRADTLVDIGSSFATLLLVGLTAIYVVATKRSVEQDSEDEEYVCKSIKSEIKQMDSIVRDHQDEGISSRIWWDSKTLPEELIILEQLPTHAYQSHVNSLDVLGTAQATKVVEFYCTVQNVKGIARSARERETVKTEVQKRMLESLKKYHDLRPKVVEMLEGDRKPDEVVSKTLDEEVTAESESKKDSKRIPE